MKIIFFTPNLETHGGNLVMLKYANYLARKENEIIIISSDRVELKDVHKKVKLKHYRASRCKYLDFFLLQRTNGHKITRLIEAADFFIPIYTPLLPLVLRAKRKKKLKGKIIFFFQDSFNMIWAGRFIKKILKNKRVISGIEKTICVSDSATQELRSASNLQPEVIYNGIDRDVFFNNNLARSKNILFVGRPSRAKGFSCFFKAYSIAKKRFNDLNATVVTPQLPRLKKKGVNYVIRPSRKELAKIYNKAAIYVGTSRDESFGLPPLEAMACGTPVVITKTSGSTSYAKNRINCLTVPIDNYKSVANAITLLLEDQKLAKRLVTGGLKTAEKFAWDKRLKQFEACLKKCQ